MAPHLGRKLSDLKQKSLGRQALRFQLELVPYYLDDIPANVKHASFMWERGAKLQYTEPSPVNQAEQSVYWGNTLLKQTATVYQENGRLMGKDYLFKVQAVEPGTSKRSTFAKCKIDMAQFCSLDGHDVREIDVKLKPQGTLRISISTTWLQHSSPENDTMTEISAMSLERSPASSLADQDLTGFDERQSGRLPSQRQPLDLSYKARSQPSPLRGSGPLGRGVNSLPGSLSGYTPPASPRHSRIRTSRFQDVDSEEVVTPTMAKPRRAPPPPPAAARMDRARSETPSAAQPSTSSQSSSLPKNPLAPTRSPGDRNKILEDFATLVASDSDVEDESRAGLVASARRWWTSGKKDEGPERSPYEPGGLLSAHIVSATSVELNTEDATALRKLCKQALRERDQERLLRQQAERQVAHLQADCEALAMSKSMMVERLRETEDRLLTVRQEEHMNNLVQTKIRLAQADYANLELQGYLSSEREKVRSLKAKLTDLEAAYHATLDSLDRLQPDAPGTPHPPFALARSAS